MKRIFFIASALAFSILSIADNNQKQIILLNDNSTLNATAIAHFAQPQSVDELKTILADARQKKLKVSLAGKRHSQGGQSLCHQGIVIDINKLNNIIALDTDKKTITVQPGVTWEQIQEYINPHGLSIKVMQASNIFTVGGSASVNVHGRDPHYGPLIETIESCKVLLADGAIVTTSRTENYDLFRHVIGGYGLFGIIIEITLSLTDNSIYQKHAEIIGVDHYVDFFQKNIQKNKDVGLHFGRIIIHDPLHKKWGRIHAISYSMATDEAEYPDNVYVLKAEKNIGFNKRLLNSLRKSNIAKAARVPLELAHERKKEIISRNNAMRPPILCLEYTSPHDTDILQEYFVPCAQLAQFIPIMQRILEKYKVNILNITIRFVPASPKSLLSYAPQECFALVLYVNHQKHATAIKQVQEWTQKLIDAALNHGGSYYLPYSLYATDTQIRQAYPNLDAFFKHKSMYDPAGIMSNTFYTRYVTHVSYS